MKTKWYFFLLTILAASASIYVLFDFKEEQPIKIGVLMVGENRYEKFLGLQKGIEELGFGESEIDYTLRNANDNQETLREQIGFLLHSKLDLIVTLGGIETSMLKEEMVRLNKKIPVVFAGVAAPKELGLIDDYRKPGGQFTGINNYHTSISGKRLELLTSLVPSITKVHVIYDSEIKVSQLSLNETIEAANKLNILIEPSDVNTDGSLRTLRKTIEKDEGVLVLPSYRIESLTNEIVSLANEKHIPAMGLYEFDAEQGMLASYGASFYSQGYQAARFVSLIIQGNQAADLPVELPDSIRFVLNKQTKESLNVSYNQDLLMTTDFIVNSDNKGGQNQ